jgi:hypothetical protein
MAYPPTFTAYAWEDLPSENTPVDKAELNQAEKRLAKFAEEFQGVNWRPPVTKESELNSLYKPKGTNVRIGDVAYVVELNEVFTYGASEEWKPISVTVPHWRPPVTKASELPVGGNVLGDIRFVTETSQFWYCYKTTGGAFEEQWKEFVQTVHHWMPPVTKHSELPTVGNVLGDVRVVTELEEFYICKKTTGTLEEQWQAFGHTHTVEQITWAVQEKVTASVNKIPGPFIRVGGNEVQKLIEIEVGLGKGKGANEIEYSLEYWNGSEWKTVEGVSKQKLKKEEVKSITVSTPLALANKYRLRLNIESVSAEPEEFALTAFVEHIAKVV